MHLKKKIRVLHLFLNRPRKSLHLIQKKFENFCTFVEKSKTDFASCKKD